MVGRAIRESYARIRNDVHAVPDWRRVDGRVSELRRDAGSWRFVEPTERRR
jgi:hypothetical protein